MSVELRTRDQIERADLASRLAGVGRAAPFLLGVVTLGGVGVLLLWDARPALFPAGAHAVLGALPLALIAVAYLAHQALRRPTPIVMFRSAILAVAFLFWAANQLWPDLPAATLFNDVAIALFVLDVLLVMIGWPPEPPPDDAGRSPTRDPKPTL